MDDAQAQSAFPEKETDGVWFLDHPRADLGQQLGVDILVGVRRQTFFHFLDGDNRHVRRRRVDGRNDVETSMLEEQLERRFRLAALRSERGELYHLRATRQISNETLQKLLHDLDLLEALLIEDA